MENNNCKSSCSLTKKIFFKIILATAISGIFFNGVMILTWGVLFKDVSEQFAFLYRDFRIDPVAKLMWVFGFLFTLTLAIGYKVFYKAVKCCDCNYSKGLWYGFYIWLIYGFAGNLAAHSLYPYTIYATLIAVVSSFVATLGASVIISKILSITLQAECDSWKAENSSSDASCSSNYNNKNN
jgi:hypothetical protein